jgi:hypothetical protein
VFQRDASEHFKHNCLPMHACCAAAAKHGRHAAAAETDLPRRLWHAITAEVLQNINDRAPRTLQLKPVVAPQIIEYPAYLSIAVKDKASRSTIRHHNRDIHVIHRVFVR